MTLLRDLVLLVVPELTCAAAMGVCLGCVVLILIGVAA